MFSNTYNSISSYFTGRNDETLFVIIEGETYSERFPIEIAPSKTVGHLKQLIKEANPTTLGDIDARKLKIWYVFSSVPYTEYDERPVLVKELRSRSEYFRDPTENLTDFFMARIGSPFDIIVQRRKVLLWLICVCWSVCEFAFFILHTPC
ncbi:hypothetical protein BKA57DRAFT_465369 [Linnemannia elongata]|nr:hypothetical protein BKA57DRAFT_465369 [Linnemannia elongata]